MVVAVLLTKIHRTVTTKHNSKYAVRYTTDCSLKKNLNAPRPSVLLCEGLAQANLFHEHAPPRGCMLGCGTCRATTKLCMSLMSLQKYQFFVLHSVCPDWTAESFQVLTGVRFLLLQISTAYFFFDVPTRYSTVIDYILIQSS